MIKQLILIAGLFISCNLFAKATVLSTNVINLDKLTLVGEGTMKVVFWQVYNAQLYSENIPFKIDNYPQMLKITYLRDIDKKDLLEATDDQWKHIGTSEVLRKKWRKSLKSIFPTVQPQDVITLYVDNKKVSHFYLSSGKKPMRPIGQVIDSQFGPQFLNIWLAKNTSRPALRRKLLGEKR